MRSLRPLSPAAMLGVAAFATVMAVAWRAAEEHRGLDLADFRSVVIVAAVVGAAALWLARSGGQSS